MCAENIEHISFEVETSRILQILSSEIYDSPNALLRENVQNAYDAILMRCEEQNLNLNERLIDISITNNTLIVTDDGIGMDENVLRNNFWKAGSSGKKTELAQRSGVIGTFGIGAMANFGVCSSLKVETRNINSDKTLISIANRDELKISEDCIELNKVSDSREPGTKITAILDETYQINEKTIRSYLEPYVMFLPVPVNVNGTTISQQSYQDTLTSQSSGFESISNRIISQNNYSGTLNTSINSRGQVLAKLSEISLNNNSLSGELFLIQNGGRTMGLRNLFGLAPIPVSGQFQLGGYVNLQILLPTAGREALSRESIQHVNNLINMIECEISTDISETDAADKNNSFQQYILSQGKIELAKNIKVNLLPARVDIPLFQLKEYEPIKKIHFYSGRDQTTIQTFGTEQTNLIHISQTNPRRKLQIKYIQNILNIEQVPDNVITNEIPSSKLSIEEAMFLLRVRGVLLDDYLMWNTEVSLAKISHGVSFHVEKIDETTNIRIANDTPAMQAVLECYKTARDVFEGFVKDFIREHLYPHIRNHVPSSTKEGRDALYKRLKMNKELYRIEEKDYGDIESLLADFIGGKTNLGDVLRTSKQRTSIQRQRVSSNQVSSVEEVMPDIIEQSVPIDKKDEFEAAPPIIRPKLPKSIKVLTVSSKYAKLNNFQMFLALSDRLFKKEGEFLRWPHTTKLIWGVHRIIYIFSDETNSLSLYYDIDLKEPLDKESTGGGMFPTTTIYTDNRIYVPIPPQLESVFKIVEGVKEFLVRFDTIP